MTRAQKRYALEKAAKMISDPKYKRLQLTLISLRWRALQTLRDKIVR